MTRSPTTTGPAKPSPTGFCHTLRGPAGRPGIRQRRPAVDAVSRRSEKLRPVGRGAIQRPMLDGQSGHESGRGDECQQCSAHGAEDTTSYTALVLRKAALFALATAIGAAGLYQVSGRRIARDGSGIWPRFFSSEANYDALEADRARRRQQAVPASNAANPSPSAPIVPRRQARGTRGPRPRRGPPKRRGTASDVADADRLSGPPPGSWPDFRGRNRDGRYDEAAIRTDWPRDGLPLLWKQPIGLGYASFVAADGRAFTIEQRRREEVVVGVRRRHGPRAVDARLGGRVHRIHGRRRPARDADLPRGPPLCARRAGRASMP